MAHIRTSSKVVWYIRGYGNTFPFTHDVIEPFCLQIFLIYFSGSPYTLEIVDSSMVTASGEGLGAVEVNKTASFVVHTHGASASDIKVQVQCKTMLDSKSWTWRLPFPLILRRAKSTFTQ